jgi:hypothetical protein
MGNFIICVIRQTLLRALGGKCNNYRMIRTQCSILFGKPEGKRYFDSLDTDGKIILKLSIR